MHLGLSQLRLARRQGGGGGGTGMRVGLNLGGVNTYSGAFPFANLVKNGTRWTVLSGTGSISSQDQGTVTVTGVVGTLILQMYICDAGFGLASGTYTLSNPNGYNVGVGNIGNQQFAAFSTSTSRTFAWPGAFNSAEGMFLYLSITANGTYGTGIEIIQPNCPNYPTDIFHPNASSFWSGLNLQQIRCMDWNDTNNNIDQDFTDRCVTTGASMMAPGCANPQVPYEYQIALANKLNKDLWINVPVRATQAYVNSLASLVNTNLNSNLKVYVETCNEVWNTAGSFQLGYNWIQFLNHTRISGTVAAATGTITKTAHGLVNGQIINCFVTRTTRSKGIADTNPASNYSVACWGRNAFVSVVDANNFKIYTEVGLVNQITFPTGVTDIIYIVQNEAGKTIDLEANYAALALRNWQAFDTAMGSSRVKAVLGSQAGNSGLTTSRLAPAGTAARCNHIGIAPYFYPYFFGGAIDVSTGQFLPKAWSNVNSVYHQGETMTVHCGVYTNGSTPTDAQVKAGTGTGFVARTTPFTANYVNNTYTSGVAIAGLVNGTTYTVIMIFVDPKGYNWRISQNITASATTSTVDFLDTYANQTLRNYEDLDSGSGGYKWIADHKTAIAGSSNTAVTLALYEGGMHLDNLAEVAPTAIKNWIYAYTEDTQFRTALTHYMNALSDLNVDVYCHFGDASDYQTPSLSWRIANSYTDTSDVRYLALSSFSGFVPRNTLVDSGTLSGAAIPTAPTLPYTVYTFANPTWTYSIAKGNSDNNYSISTNNLIMNTTTGINFGVPVTQTVTIYATDGNSDAIFDVQFVTGSAWYEGDALFALDMTVQADATLLTAAKGNNLPRTSGTTNTFAGGLMDELGANTHDSTTAMASLVDLTKPVLFACVLQKDNQATNFVDMVQFATGIFASLATSSGTALNWRFFNGSADEPDMIMDWTDNVKAVFWLFVDRANNKMYWGKNQTEANAAGGRTATNSIPAAFTQRTINIFAQQEKIGSMEIVNRTGLTVTDAKAMVQKIQTLHGI